MGTASRRYFHGPGTINFDLALRRFFKFSERRMMEFRLETFNTFNHAEFFGPAAVNGDIDSALFGHVVNAVPRAWCRRRLNSHSDLKSQSQKAAVRYIIAPVTQNKPAGWSVIARLAIAFPGMKLPLETGREYNHPTGGDR